MDEEDFEDLINALKDEDSDVQEKATKALIEMGEPAVEPLIQALKDEYASVQKGAVEALGDIGNAKAVEPLVELLKDENTQIRLEIVMALEKLGWTPRDETDKAYYLVAKEQWRELARLGEPAVAPLFQALKKRDEDEVRLRIVEALGDIHVTQALRRKD